jgi:hypothetical protein
MSDGGDLRTQLESALQKVTEQAATIRSYQVAELLRRPDFNLVTAGDLADAEDLEKAAAEAQQRNQGQLRERLESSGLDKEQIAKVLAGEKLAASPGAAKLDRYQTGTGTAPPPLVDQTNLHGRAAVKAHFAKEAAGRG